MALTLLDLVWTVLALPVLAVAGYLGVLTLLSARLWTPTAPAAPRIRFDVVVPAHNEEAGIARTVENLLALDYPKERFRILVVADNCQDQTAARARAAGATVLERVDLERRGKGYALAHAFAHSLREAKAEAVVVVDADTLVSKNLLQAYAARLEAGAHAVQAHYAVLGAEAGWRTQLMSVAFALFHGVRSNARERMGVSSGLRGNGMCFTHRVITEVPHDAFSVVEDLEYGLRLGRSGHRVHYAHEAFVYGEMVSSEKASRSQRTRWEGGRRLMARQYGWPLFWDALRTRSLLLFDLAMDVLVPPLAKVALCAAAGFAGACVLSWAEGRWVWALWPWTLSVAWLCLYVFRGWQLSESGWKGLYALARAPAYVAWKVWLSFAQRDPKEREWVRTTREASPKALTEEER